ncbi:Phage integrase family protein [Halarsenatibacter silvermanii]|uniref:Phage integrase family protein n=2 Tax=Halarsenatibacter silvermanii TaxID=321763 RepID=A0A1G9S9B5_9FIRM|nr:Phage integrase family protein [Halarsenatibacter silvermanii]
MGQNYRNYLLFVVGINTGLRISDMLKLKVEDVKNKTHIYISEGKTGKSKKFFINLNLREDIDMYIKNMKEEEHLFQSRNGNNKPLSRSQVYRILNKAADNIDLDIENFGCHSLRKTFGYHHYQKYKDVALLQDIFNHSSPSVTLVYIGINQDVKDKSLQDFYL